MRNLTEDEIRALESIPVTTEQVAEFMAEWDSGKYQLTSGDEAALERSRHLFMAQLKDALAKEQGENK